MNSVDHFSLLLHKAVAEKMLRNEDRVFQIAKVNLKNWLASPAFAISGRRALLEWKNILETSSADQIRQLIISETDEGQRLRSSSPFAGVLTETERKELFEICAKA